MGPSGRPADSGSRFWVVSTSRMLIGFLFMAAFGFLSLYGYFFVFGLKSSSTPTRPLAIGLLVVVPLAMVIGLAVGGWVWGFLGKRVLGFTREEVETLVTPALPIPWLVRYKNWYLNVLFGPRTSPSARRAGAPGPPVLDSLSDGPTSVQKVLYECSAYAITKNWDERTTKNFDMAMVRTDWFPSRKGILRFMSQSLTFEDWTIPYAEIDDAVVTLLKGILPGYYLRIRAKGQPYQFSIVRMNARYFRGELPFPARRVSTEGFFTWGYVLARLLPILAFLAFFLWTRRR
jgi:hypothetical protein